MEKRALGKGLSALIPPKETSAADAKDERGLVINIPVSQIVTNKYQPRIEFSQEKLNDLVNSIKEKGVIQPILVRKTTAGYELIAGERRLRAVKNIGIETIPAILKEASDLDMLEIALIENIQREELNPIEEAQSFQRFITEFKFTQERIAQVLGKDRSTIANTLRLLSLPKKIQDFISGGTITAGHAKTLLALPSEIEQLRVCTIIIKKGLSVREAEKISARRTAGHKITSHIPAKGHHVEDIENQLQHFFGTRVTLVHGKKRGKILIEYYSNDDLDRVLDLILKKR